MRAVVQRVSSAQVTVDGEVVGSIGQGLCVLLGAMDGDNDTDIDFMVRKISTLRIFQDDAGKMNLSVLDIEGKVLIVSQFTLASDTTSGTRPSFTNALAPELAEPMIMKLCDQLRGAGLVVATGSFGARMDVELVNHGPVTIILDSRNKLKK